MEKSPLLDRKKIGINAITSSLQVFVVGVIYFFLYSFLLHKLGSPLLGVWSLVLATASLATMANLGITGGLVKFIAEFYAKGNEKEITTLLRTAFTSIFIFFGALAIILYFVLLVVLKKIVAPAYLPVALQMLPYSLASLFINEIGSVFTSLLDGLQKNYKRNVIYMVSSILMLVTCYLLVPKLGLIAVAYAQVGQAVCVAISAFIVSTGLFNLKEFLYSRWDRKIFKMIFGYGIKFQFISVCQMLYEPTTKALLSKFGGLSTVAYYEMGAKLVNQIRALIVNANQVVVPVVASVAVNNKAAINKIYSYSMSLVLFITVPLMTGLVFFASSISFLWIGHVEPVFVFSVTVVSIGMFFNIMGTPAYYGFMGEGKLNFILLMHFLIAVINITAGYLLSKLLPSYGAILGWGIALVIGSTMILLNYQKDKNIKFNTFFVSKDYLLLAVGVLTVLIPIIFYYYFSNSASLKIIQFISLEAFAFALLYIPVLFVNQNFKFLFSLLQNLFKKQL